MNILKLLRKTKSQPATKTYCRLPRLEIMLSGTGGQGIILAGKILAEAATVYDNKEAVMSQSYGPEARGGASRAEVIISSEEIYYPKVMQVNVLLAMSKQALDKYHTLLYQDGLLIVDSTFIKDIPGDFKNVCKIPFTSDVVHLMNNPIVANVMALGCLCYITGAVSREALIKSVIDYVPRNVLQLDRIAVDAGIKAAKEKGYKSKFFIDK